MNAPLDARTVVNTLADLTDSGSFPYFYEGMLVSCKANKKVYQLIGNDPTDTDNWEQVGSSGGGSQVSITPTLTQGRKIADYEIDGEAGELYAPRSGGGSSSVEYSYDEIDIGTWVDGSTVYQKVVPITIPTTSTDGTQAQEDTNIGVNIDKLVKFDFVVWGSDWAGELPVWKDINPAYHLRAYVYNSNTIRTINTCANYSGLQAFAIIQYTKDLSQPLVPTMTSDTTPSGQVIYSSVWQDGTGAYKSWYAFDGNDSTGWAGTIQTGNYIGYHFENPVRVTKAYMVNQQQGTSASFRIQASNDGTNWVSVSDEIVYGGSENPSTFNVEVNTDGNYYTYYRLYNISSVSTTANTYTLQFYGYEKEIVALVPTMTSNTEPSGEAAASSAQSGADAYRVFDGDKTTYWNCTSTTGTVQYHFENPVIITSVYAYVASNNQTVSIEASNDGTNWTTLVESFALTGGTEETKDVTSAAAYTYARATVTKQAGSTAWLHELQFYGYEV